MKIAVFSNLYYPFERGGAERMVRRSVRELVLKGNEAIVVTMGNFRGVGSFGIEKHIGEHGETVARFFPFNFFSFLDIQIYAFWFFIPLRAAWHFFDIFNLHSYFVVRGFLEKEKPDLIYTHNMKGMGFLSVKAIQRYVKKNQIASWVHYLHDVQLVVPSGLLMASESGRREKAQIYFYRWYSFLCMLIIGSPTAVVSPTKWLLSFHKSLGFFKKSNFEIMERANGIPTTKKNLHKTIFLFVGQIEPHKGVMLLVKAWKIWVDKVSEEKDKTEDVEAGMSGLPMLHIVGAGSIADEVRMEADGDSTIKYHGELPHEKVSDIMFESRAIFLPSIVHENAPNVIHEAHARGTTVVATRVGGVSELLKNEDILIEPGKIEDLIFAFDKLMRGELSI